MRSIVMRVCQVPADNPHVTTALEATRTYADDVKISAPDKKGYMGPPHPHIWNVGLGQRHTDIVSLPDRSHAQAKSQLQSYNNTMGKL